MLMCKVCNRTIANAGNPKILYSTCIDCGHKYEKEERLLGQVSDDKELSELESLENSNPDDGSWKGR